MRERCKVRYTGIHRSMPKLTQCCRTRDGPCFATLDWPAPAALAAKAVDSLSFVGKPSLSRSASVGWATDPLDRCSAAGMLYGGETTLAEFPAG